MLPAAAEAKEAGAIVVVGGCGRYDGGVEALGFVVVERQTDWGQLRKFEVDVKLQADLG